MLDNNNTYYYAIVYFKHKELCAAGPYDSYDKMMNAMKEAVAKNHDMVKATTYMTRKEKLSLEELFGHPRSRDIMQDKKFLKEITL